jgi:hypothetical protein
MHIFKLNFIIFFFIGSTSLILAINYSEKESSKYEIEELPKAKVLADVLLEDHDWCQPLNIPTWRSSSEAAYMKPDDPVLGIYLKNKAWALPWWIMKNHHVANLTLENQPVLVTFCEMCSSAAAFDPILEGARFNFRYVGQYNGTILIADKEGNDFWVPFTGEALTGPYQGTSLKAFPLYQSTWAQWLEQHPESLVLYGTANLRQGHGSEFFPGCSRVGEGFLSTLLQPLDDRLPHNTLILGVSNADHYRAYPVSELDQAGSVLNDRLGESDIVIFHEPETLLGMTFSRQSGEQSLVFKQSDSGEITDTNTGSLWNMAGEAYEGPLKGKKLSFIRSLIEEWYIWAATHPETEIFNTQN